MVLKTSLCLNTAIVFTMAAIAIASKSLALLSALVENVIDLFVRGMLAYAGTRTSKQADHAKFPAGTSRLEPVAVIISACVMMVVSIVFIQEGIMKLVDGFGHGTPEPPHLSVSAIVIVTFAVVSKIILNAY
ncbi:hypothetical protein Poli38472_009227 [Pythium oligandrum]|uniref:Cation efflux protein transmembrane domain-containing protein n=1 Tax=Pythium oligandrum TaxID=41045 RepID=A0A8K1CLY2_PYTOL|nr:hypothetical protein Poli38472_009227 [Pythium oligandrum]|eukprot:TMW65060.1 hypothetical protein Poli38472_009227 [Pythium oligandrum]